MTTTTSTPITTPVTTTNNNTQRSEEASHGVVVPNKWYEDWVKENIKDMTGQVAIITGANSGTGFWAAMALAGHGCEVILACRSEQKAKAAIREIQQAHPTSKVHFIAPLDNMDFASVRAFAKTFQQQYTRLDLLLNNAGIMAQPLIESKDGFDVQIQTNHLSHFLLTRLLWNTLVSSPGQSRVVQHSSGAHHVAGPVFDKHHMKDPSYKWGWFGINVLIVRVVLPLFVGKSDMWVRYGVSKLCNVLFMRELERKIEANKDGALQDKVISVACHPGYANTNLQNAAHGMSHWEKYNANSAQSAADGSLPLLMAAISDNVKNGDYIGPSGRNEMTGPPKHVCVQGSGNDVAMAKSLWEYSEECIGEKFEI